MKKRIAAAIIGFSLLLVGCQVDQTENERPMLAENPSIANDTQPDMDSARETLIRYLTDCWGYREGVYRFVFDAVIELHQEEYSVFKVYFSEDEYLNSFAISLLEKKVYVSDGRGEWIEDINPDPWTKWE